MVGSRVNLGSNSFVCSLVGHLAFRNVNCFVRSNIGCLIWGGIGTKVGSGSLCDIVLR
jgi:hypothetical protein